MEGELYELGLEMRAVAHVMHFLPDIADRIEDCDFMCSIISVLSDYFYFASDRTLEKVSCNFTDTGFDRRAVFGSDFSDEIRRNFENAANSSEDVPERPTVKT